MKDNTSLVCTWKESPNGKGDYYIPSCLDTRINVLKWAKKHNRNVIDLFLSCPFCGRKVKL